MWRSCEHKVFPEVGTTYCWMFPKIVVYPQIIHFYTVFHDKPSILGYPYFGKHPYRTGYAMECQMFTPCTSHNRCKVLVTTEFILLTRSIFRCYDTFRQGTRRSSVNGILYTCLNCPVQVGTPLRVPTPSLHHGGIIKISAQMRDP